MSPIQRVEQVRKLNPVEETLGDYGSRWIVERRSAEHLPPRLAAAVSIAAWCALRYGELAELRRKDMDVVNHVIKVLRAVIFPRGGPVVGNRRRRPASRKS